MNEKLFTNLDLEENLHGHARIRIHMGKTHKRKQQGVEPHVCATLQWAAEVVNNHVRVWRGSGLPTHEQGIRVLGAPVGHLDFVRDHL